MKYDIWDIVLYWDKSIFCEYFPMEVKIMSKRKFSLFWFYYYTRIKHWMPDWIHEWKTKRIYEKRIEKYIKKFIT
jgi:hypothetical protein